ncbi:MAG TPA: alpha-L-fucosidase [Bacteroidota bacterium]|nr:alpha-L-fucosidase [Bacteroidota bacterium]
MKTPLVLLMLLALSASTLRAAPGSAAGDDRGARMQWWREARFGLFIHWGLYAVPAGVWDGRTDHAEWIRTTAQIPLREYEGLMPRFNPRHFDPASWVSLAKDAGMKYIVITTKHHDGFCMFDTKQTSFGVMSTPFHRDVMKALADACHAAGIRICWYYSIMDWHHSDYLPRREWEKDRSDSGAVFSRYVAYMKAELKELLTNYGPIGVLWFDGEWESTWNPALGRDLYDYVRALQPGIIINNRVGAGRSGMEGFTKEGEFSGDFGTPEQEVPARGLPGVDWETCMTMNDHWGYNSHDAHWKSTVEIVRTLADVASKGGNFLLNIGPTADGEFPPASVERLRGIGAWMRTHGAAIHGTTASPFASLPWGRCTVGRRQDGGTRLYCHVFDWPHGGTLVVPGLMSDPERAYMMGDTAVALSVGRREDALLVSVGPPPADTTDPVVVLELRSGPDVVDPPAIVADCDIFTDSLAVTLRSERAGAEIRYTLDGTVPSASSPLARGPLVLTASTPVSARVFRGERPAGPVASAAFTRVRVRPSVGLLHPLPGVAYSYYQGAWDSLPDFSRLTPLKAGTLAAFETPRERSEDYGFLYECYVRIPRDGVYTLATVSDDGSRLFIDGQPVVENDGQHGMTERSGVIALGAGFHRLRLEYFNRSGGAGLEVWWKGPSIAREHLPAAALFR